MQPHAFPHAPYALVNWVFPAGPPEAPESVVINGEQLHNATGIASEASCSAGAAAAVATDGASTVGPVAGGDRKSVV